MITSSFSDIYRDMPQLIRLSSNHYSCFSNYKTFYKSKLSPEVPMHVVDAGNSIYLDFDVPWKLGHSGGNIQQLSSSIRLGAERHKDNKELAHQLLCRLMSPFHEQSVQRLQPHFVNELPMRTPDIIIETDVLALVEIKTAVQFSRKVYEESVRKYNMSGFGPVTPAGNMSIMVTGTSFTVPDGLVLQQTFVNEVCSVIGQIQACLIAKSSYGPSNFDEQIRFPQVSLARVPGDSRLTVDDAALQRMWDIEPVDHFTRELKKEALRPKCRKIARAPVWTEVVETKLLHDFPLVLSPATSIPDLTMIENGVLRQLTCNYWFKRNLESRKFLPSENREERKVNLQGTMESLISENTEDVVRGLWLKSLVDSKISYFNTADMDAAQVAKLKRKLEKRVQTWRTCLVRDRIVHLLEEKEAAKREEWVRNPADALTRFDTQELISDLLAEVAGAHMEEQSVPMETGGAQPILYQNEAWSCHMRFWQEVYSELNISVRGAATRNQRRFLAQRIGSRDAYLFTQSKGHGQHIFYYVLAHLSNGPIRPKNWQKLNDGWWCTRRVQSVTQAVIEQRLYSFNKLYTLRTFFEDRASSEDWMMEFATAYLIATESKQRTLDLLSLFRYLYMEMSKPFQDADPEKIFGKVDFPLRTKLDSHIVASMLQVIKAFREDRGSLLQNVSWITLRPLRTFDALINLSYYQHVIKNQQSHGLSAIFQTTRKIIMEEAKLTSEVSSQIMSMDRNGLEDMKSHTYSPQFVAALGAHLSKKVKRVYSEYSKFEEAWKEELMQMEYEYFATFRKTTDLDLKTRSNRTYCFIKITDLLKQYLVSPYQDLKNLVTIQSVRPDSRCITIFKKDQQTGVREIFVLPMVLRILVKAIESMSEMISRNCLDNEAMSNPRLKETILINHNTKVLNKMKFIKKNVGIKPKKVYTGELKFMASSDAKTWSQQFTMPNFIQMFVTMLKHAYGDQSRSLVRFITFVLNQITNKEIVFDQSAVDWCRDLSLEELAQIKSRDDDFSRFVDTLRGSNKGGRYGFKNESNMMQGITHFISSLLHSSYMDLCKVKLNQVVKGLAEGLSRNMEWDLFSDGMVIDTIVSSDDSGMYCTFPYVIGYESEDQLPAIQAAIKRLANNITTFGRKIDEYKPLMGARMSPEKTTEFALNEVFEFNSRFFYKTGEYVPEIKFCTSVFHPGFHEFPSERVDEALSSLTNSLVNGISQTTLYSQQLMLNRMHRHLITNRVTLSPEEERLRSPIIGWVPLMRKGLIGFFNTQQLTSYLVCTGAPNADLYNARFFLESEVYDTRVKLSLVRRTKLNKMLSKMGVSQETVTQQLMQVGPEFLINRLPQALKIHMKLLSPGANAALAFTTLSRLHAVSCYANTRQVFTLRQEHDNASKMTYSDVLNWVAENRHKLPVVKPEYYDVPSMAYLSSVNWDAAAEVEKSLVVRPFDRKANKFYLEGLKVLPDTSSVLLDCYDFWVGNENPRNRIFMSFLKSIDGRISESYSETIENFHKRPQELKTFLLNVEMKDKRILYFGPLLRTASLEVHLSNYLKHNWSGHKSLLLQRSGAAAIETSCKEIQVSTAWEAVRDLVSNAFTGWESLRTFWLDEATSALHGLEVPLSRTSQPDVQLLCLYIKHRKNPFMEIPVTRYLRSSVVCLHLSSSIKVLREGGRWHKLFSSCNRSFHEPTDKDRERFMILSQASHETLFDEFSLDVGRMRIFPSQGSICLTTVGNALIERTSFCAVSIPPMRKDSYCHPDRKLSMFVKKISEVVLFSPDTMLLPAFIPWLSKQVLKESKEKAVYKELTRIGQSMEDPQKLIKRARRKITRKELFQAGTLPAEAGEFLDPDDFLDERIVDLRELAEAHAPVPPAIACAQEEEDIMQFIVDAFTRPREEEEGVAAEDSFHNSSDEEEESYDVDDMYEEWASELKGNPQNQDVPELDNLVELLGESWEDCAGASLLYMSGDIIVPCETRDCWTKARNIVRTMKTNQETGALLFGEQPGDLFPSLES
uniref:RNA-directed RNA polymerase L n=1 Tax=Huangshi Humpbacked Fly Virus TaxID=1608050 RepID=A0A0B5KF77_9VIRU|nr:RNA-dependent RNA polymerase [Huangshi Humpbacked Fly Virus]